MDVYFDHHRYSNSSLHEIIASSQILLRAESWRQSPCEEVFICWWDCGFVVVGGRWRYEEEGSEEERKERFLVRIHV